jgi:hypothetical protein
MNVLLVHGCPLRAIHADDGDTSAALAAVAEAEFEYADTPAFAAIPARRWGAGGRWRLATMHRITYQQVFGPQFPRGSDKERCLSSCGVGAFHLVDGEARRT